ncbi:MAG: glycogen/starch/alpha-glucan family phosphorylase [Parachlamydiales bacterium]|nr:glycogen/starch/alpha-glucan family phosphorylase [Parachlamydiales bacterium]
MERGCVNNNIEFEANELIQKIKHFLITNLGKVENVASTEEFYLAFCIALREKIMVNWTTTEHSHNEAGARTLYYLCMEYLPGKFLSNNITNLNSTELVSIVLKKMGRNLKDLLFFDVDPGLGNGGLGRLASCFLDSLATQKYPSWAYGLRYQYGIFEQEIWNGYQIERPECWLLNQFPWEFRKDTHAQNIKFGGNLIPAINRHGDEVFDLEDYEEVRALPYDIPIIGYPDKQKEFTVSTLRLWSTKESPRNFELQRYNAGQMQEAGENTALTDVLYPNDNHELGKKIRLKQEFILVSASLQDILHQHLRIHGEIMNLADKVQIQINDTHPALVVAELIKRLVKNHDVSFKDAFEITKNVCNYTNHTIMREALEEWNEMRVQSLLPRHYKIIQKINNDFCNNIRKQFPNDEEKINRMSIIHNGQIRMAHLAILGSKKVNGVAYLHTEILKKEIFKDFNEMFPEKFIPITNGITQRRWLLESNPLLAEFLTKRITNKWITDFHDIHKIKDFADDKETINEFIRIKNENKKRLFDYIKKENPIRDFKGKIVDHYPIFEDSEDVLVDVQIKRLHEYKRQLMNCLHLLILYDEIKKDPTSRKIKRLVLMAGKAAPGYDLAKKIILLFFLIAIKINNDPEVQKVLKVVLIENYNVSKAQIIIPASDLSEQISTAGYEASGTGNMKLSINGALTIGTEDGANIEMRQAITDEWWPFSFGSTLEEIKKMKNEKSYNALDFYKQHEHIRKAVDRLKDGSLARNDAENQALSEIYNLLVSGDNPDKYFVLKDLFSFYETQKRVEQLYLDKEKWAKFAIHNIGGMSRFSSDEVINNYAKSVWEIEPCPLEPYILDSVKREYEETTTCFVCRKDE